jgi:hypothetical protein
MDMLERKKVTVYDGYKPNDDTIIFFWEVRKNMFFSDSKLRLHISDSLKGRSFAKSVHFVHFVI